MVWVIWANHVKRHFWLAEVSEFWDSKCSFAISILKFYFFAWDSVSPNGCNLQPNKLYIDLNSPSSWSLSWSTIRDLEYTLILESPWLNYGSLIYTLHNGDLILPNNSWFFFAFIMTLQWLFDPLSCLWFIFVFVVANLSYLKASAILK